MRDLVLAMSAQQSPPDLDDRFFQMWVDMCTRLRVDPFDLIRVAYAESGCRASAHNPKGDASGLIQFMPDTLKGLGWLKGHEAFRAIPADDQVPWAECYYRPHAEWCKTDALCYVATFLPALGPRAAQMGEDFVLCGARGPLAWAYGANKVLDRDGDGAITVGDLGRQLVAQCKGARWDAIVWRLRQAMGLQPPAPPEQPITEPELPLVNTPMLPPPPEETAGSGPILHPFRYGDPDDDAA